MRRLVACRFLLFAVVGSGGVVEKHALGICMRMALFNFVIISAKVRKQFVTHNFFNPSSTQG